MPGWERQGQEVLRHESKEEGMEFCLLVLHTGYWFFDRGYLFVLISVTYRDCRIYCLHGFVIGMDSDHLRVRDFGKIAFLNHLCGV